MGLSERLRRIERRADLGANCPACGLPVDGRSRLQGVNAIPRVYWHINDSVLRNYDDNPVDPP